MHFLGREAEWITVGWNYTHELNTLVGHIVRSSVREKFCKFEKEEYRQRADGEQRESL